MTTDTPSFMSYLRNGISRGGRSGFTLIELMVVILIISILSGIVLTSLSGNDPAQSLASGSRRLSGVFSLGRSAAITRKTRTRVLVNYDNTSENFLKSALIVYLDDTDPANPVWKVYSDVETLPQGVFFSTEYSMKGDGVLKTWTVGLDPGTYALDDGGDDTLAPASAPPSSGKDRWFAYEFNPNGTFGDDETRGAWIVLASGVLNQTELIVPDDTLVDGFVMFRAGRPMYFQDPLQITEAD